MVPFVLIVVIFTVAFLFLRLQVRRSFYPFSSIEPRPMDDVAIAISRFERALGKYAPEVLGALQPGLSDGQIAAIMTNYGLLLTEDLAALYRWRNGSARTTQFELIPGHRFVPLEEAAQMRVDLRRQASSTSLAQRLAYAVFAGHRTEWLTVLEDGCGDGYFYDPARRRHAGSFFYCFAEDRSYRFFASIGSFLAGAAECYETGVYRPGPRGRISEDFEQSLSLWQRYSFAPTRA